MKFSTREDIEAPIDHVFTTVSDFAAFERRALRHGAEVTRQDEGPVKLGSAWDIGFKFRGRDRRMHSTIAEIDPPNQYIILTVSEGMTITGSVDLVALSPGRTRVAVAFDLRAKTLTARLLLQSMKLAKTKLNKRFKARVLEFAEDIEDDYRKAGQV
ncbi:SRPBCC family protein [Yoonia sp. 2307UL14-13]|uniref:SRPBCC family protein n=1 Tax=Yoonia sp. 2307UL14-13 TaxID=3126506 RepID=UPI0030A67DA1